MKTFEELIDMCNEDNDLVEYFYDAHLLPIKPEKKCKKCKGTMKLTMERDDTGKYMFIYECHEMEIREDDEEIECDPCFECHEKQLVNDDDDDDGYNWFKTANFSIDIETILKVIYWLLKKNALKHELIALECGTSEQNVKDLNDYMNKVVNQWFMDKSRPIGGNKRSVEIYKYKNGNNNQIIGVDAKTRYVNYFIATVQNFHADSLLPIVKEWILPHTAIKSNLWDKKEFLKSPKFNTFCEGKSISFGHLKKERLPTFNTFDMFEKAAKQKNKDIFDYFWNVIPELLYPAPELKGVRRKIYRT